MSNTPIEEKLIQDDSFDAEPIASPAPSRWGRVAVATAGAAVVLSRLAGVAHADDGADDDHDFMFATHKGGAVHDDSDTVKSADSPMTVKSALTVKSPDTALTTMKSGSVLGTTDTVSTATVTGDTLNSPTNTATPGTLTGNTADSPATAGTANTTLGIGQIVSRFANGSLSASQEGALATLFKGGLSASDVHDMKVSEFVHALKAAGLTQDQILSVLKS